MSPIRCSGPRGAAAVYGPQKGLVAADLGRLEAATAKVAAQLCEHFGRPRGLAEMPGTGAAGGISFGLMAAARARFLPGFALVSAWLNLDPRLRAADLVVTGEGRFDGSSWEGKGPGAVVARAVALAKPVHVFAGQIDGAGSTAAGRGVSLHAITALGTPLPQALREAAQEPGGGSTASVSSMKYSEGAGLLIHKSAADLRTRSPAP